jgi:uncharacterized phiE125 gp8 family phage protein
MTMEKMSDPVELAVSMEAAREALRRDDTALDLSMRIALVALIAEVEHYTGRALINRPMQVTLDWFPDAIRLASPTYSVEAVRYLDVDGAEQVLDPADYYVDKKSKPGFIVPAAGRAWPSTGARVNAVTVDFTAGYGPTDATVPNEAKDYVLGCLQLRFDPTSRVTKKDLIGLLYGLKVYQ